MKFKPGQINKKLNISNIEIKKPNDIVSDVKLFLPAEIIKFILLWFTTVFFVMLQYNNPIVSSLSKGGFIRIIYLYSFGLAFGDLMILLLIGSHLTLIIRWLSPWFKKHYFKWFFAYQKVDYWTVRNSLISFIWLNLLAIAIIYHSVLVFYRVDMSSTIINKNDIANIYNKGWFYSFTNQWSITKDKFSSLLPNAHLNVGFYADAIFNLPYLLTFSPYLSWLIALAILAFSWAKLIMINMKIYIKNMIKNRTTLPILEKTIKNNTSPFYYTSQVKILFDFYRKAANVLQIDVYKVKFSYVMSQIMQNIDKLSNNSTLSHFFVIVNKKNKSYNESESAFIKILEQNQSKYNSSPDLIIASTNPDSLLKNTKQNIKIYESDEKTSFYDTKDFETKLTKVANEDEISTFELHLQNDFNNKIKDIQQLTNSSYLEDAPLTAEVHDMILDDLSPAQSDTIVNETNINSAQNLDNDINNQLEKNAEIKNEHHTDTIGINTAPLTAIEDLINFNLDTIETEITVEPEELSNNSNSTKNIQTNDNVNFSIDTGESFIDQYQHDLKTGQNEKNNLTDNHTNFIIDTVETSIMKESNNSQYLDKNNENKIQENSTTDIKPNKNTNDDSHSSIKIKNNNFSFDSATISLSENRQKENINNDSFDDDLWESPILSDKNKD
ncbi:ring-infected erythrocyte surface antigen domain-containing protein [Mycoplasmopsis primatum]|uniref:hypothetical protein n=1 Tax=Mycoplasmopsis primatum TaxID=55604 RepID=UPI00049839DD|nr:hypothetical protein [Mycoplasmopsis primatum]